MLRYNSISINDISMMKKIKNSWLIPVVCFAATLCYATDKVISMDITPFFFLAMVLLCFVHIFVIVIDRNSLSRIFVLLSLIALVGGVGKLYNIGYSDYLLAIGLLSNLIAIIILISHSFFSNKKELRMKLLTVFACLCILLRVILAPFGRGFQSAVNLILLMLLIVLFISFHRRAANVSFLILILISHTCFSLINYTVTELI